MTEKQREQFNRMLATLKRIASGYQTPDQIKRNAEKQYGWSYEEVLGVAYENIQQEAKQAAKGVRPIASAVASHDAAPTTAAGG